MRARLVSLLLLLFLGAASTAAEGCVATETGNPPFQPTSETNDGFLSGESLPDDPMLPGAPQAIAAGAPGYVTPPVGEVWIWNLTRRSAPVVTEVRPDGSFEAMLEAAPRDRLRLQVVDGSGQPLSAPSDGTIETLGLGAGVATVPCVVADPEVAPVGEEGEVTLELTNACGTPARVAAAEPSPAAAPYRSDPVVLEAGAAVTVIVRVAEGSSASTAVIAFPVADDVSAPPAVTVFVP